MTTALCIKNSKINAGGRMESNDKLTEAYNDYENWRKGEEIREARKEREKANKIVGLYVLLIFAFGLVIGAGIAAVTQTLGW
jgi:hypothetical protein